MVCDMRRAAKRSCAAAAAAAAAQTTPPVQEACGRRELLVHQRLGGPESRFLARPGGGVLRDPVGERGQVVVAPVSSGPSPGFPRRFTVYVVARQVFEPARRGAVLGGNNCGGGLVAGNGGRH
jgi:hypothetical protein